MDLSIIIVNYKEPGFLKQCLKGIRLAQPPLTYEIIVVDNASGDRSVEMVREHFPDVTLIALPENRGLAVGNNLGYRSSRGRYVLFLNADIAIFGGTLEAMVRFMDDHREIGILAPKLLNPDDSIQLSCYRFPSPLVPILRRTPLGKLKAAQSILRRYLMLDWNHHTTQPVEWVLGACLFVRRQAMDDVGHMDEQFFVYFEDVDLCRRMWEGDWKVVYFADTHVVHYHQRTSAASPGFSGMFNRLTRIHIQSGIKYFRKYFRQPNPRITGSYA